MSNGKGDTRRKALVPDKVIDENWKNTYGSTKGKKKNVEQDNNDSTGRGTTPDNRTTD